MKVRVLFFGVLTDTVGKPEIEIENISTLYSLKQHLVESFPKMFEHSYVVSVNRKLIPADLELKDGDEVAFLPPFTGG